MNNQSSAFFHGEEYSGSGLYGKGIFTTVSMVIGRPFLWEKHWRRLQKDAQKISIDLSLHTEEATLDMLHTSIGASTLDVGRARITFFDERSSDIWKSANEMASPTSISIITGERRCVNDSFQLTISPFPVNSHSPLAGIKSCNYLEQILSLDEAKARSFHEAVRINERGHVTSGCMSNIFWLKNGRLYTPALATGCLAGTTREYVLENVECEEGEAEIGELELADAIYLTSAGLGIVRVAEFDGRELPDTNHPIQTLWPPS